MNKELGNKEKKKETVEKESKRDADIKKAFEKYDEMHSSDGEEGDSEEGELDMEEGELEMLELGEDGELEMMEEDGELEMEEGEEEMD